MAKKSKRSVIESVPVNESEIVTGMILVNVANPGYGTFVVLDSCNVEGMRDMRGERGSICVSESEIVQFWQRVTGR